MRVDLIKKFIYNPRMLALFLGRRQWLNWMPDKAYLKILFKAHFGYEMDFEHPRTYNEKLQWLKLYDHNPLYSTLVDKYEVREYVKNLIGEKYLVPMLWVGEDFSTLDCNSLPNKFVVKCTHDSQSVRICKDKNTFDFAECEQFINSHLKNNLFWAFREWAYKAVKPRIIIEEYLGDIKKLPEDYKFYTFDGVIDSVMVCKERDKGHPKFYFYNVDWVRQHYLIDEPSEEVEMPPNFMEMVDIVNKLSKGLPAVRVDLYNVDGKIYFGELTLYNQGGFDIDITRETDEKWGKQFKLPTD